jgi:polyisoprenyl-phosphate glycosyltransferase
MTPKREFLSIIVPIFNEEENLPELRRRLSSTVEELQFAQNEVLLISDGSVDRSEAMIRSIVAEDPLFKGVFLTRNFGHQAAVSVGLSQAKGSLVVVIDADLQDPPEAIPLLLKAIDEGADVAYAVRKHRKEGALKKVAYSAFYRLLQRLADIDIPLDSGDFSCITRPVVDAMLQLPERNRFIRGLRAWVGYRQVGVEYERAARFAGSPKYSFRKLLGLAYDGLFSFSKLPIRLIQFLGFVASGIALLIACVYVVCYFVIRTPIPPGFFTLIVSIWFLTGVQLLFLGIVGEYVVRTYDEVRHRPVALVREIVAHRDVVTPSREKEPLAQERPAQPPFPTGT